MLDIFDLQGCQLQSQLVAGKIEHEHHELWAPKIGTAWYSNKQIHCDILINIAWSTFLYTFTPTPHSSLGALQTIKMIWSPNKSYHSKSNCSICNCHRRVQHKQQWEYLYLYRYTYIYIYIYIHTYIPTYLPTCLHAYLPTYLRTYVPTYIPTYLHAYMPTCLHAYMPTCLHAYMPTCLHAYMPTYVHTCIRAYLQRVYAIRGYLDTWIHVYV